MINGLDLAHTNWKLNTDSINIEEPRQNLFCRGVVYFAA